MMSSRNRMMGTKMYDQIAPFYDLIHNGLKDDLQLLISLAAEVGDPILELGCGTGRLLLSLFRVGHRVTGIDNSPAMLDIARNKLAEESLYVRERASLLEDNISSFDLGQQFSLIILPYNTLFHLDPISRRSCFRCIGHHLLSEGLLVIDIDNPFEIADPIEDGIVLLERSMIEPGSDRVILQMTSSWVDNDAQERHMTWIFDESSIFGGVISRTVVNSVFHYVNAHRLEEEIRAAGLRLKALYGDYDRSPFGEESPRLLAFAEKPS